MTKLFKLLIVTLFSISAFADDVVKEVPEKPPEMFKNSDIKRRLKNGKIQKFDGDKYKIVRRVKRIRKATPKPVVQKKNRVSVLAGYGALGTVSTTTQGNQVIVDADEGLVMGVQYERDVYQGKDVNVHLLIQGQTNATFSGGVGVSF